MRWNESRALSEDYIPRCTSNGERTNGAASVVHEFRKLTPAESTGREAQIAELHEKMASTDYYQQPSDIIAADQKRLTELTENLETYFARWEELEAI